MTAAINGLTRTLAVVLGIMLLAMVVLSCWNVVGRYVFGRSLLWADEIAIFGMIVMAWLGAVVVAWRAMEIRMNIVMEMLPSGAQRVLGILQAIVGTSICGWAAWLSWGYVARLLRVRMTSDAAGLPVWTVHIAVTIGLAAVALIALWQGLRMAMGRRGPVTAEPVTRAE